MFDFDGVLVDSNSVKREAYFEIFRGILGAAPIVHSVIRDDIDGDRYDVISVMLQRLHAAGLLPRLEDGGAVVAEYAQRYNDIAEDAVAAAPETPGCSAALRELAQLAPMYINSATPQESLRRIVERRGWRPWFKDVLGRPRTKVENLFAILDTERILPHEVIFVGDSPKDQAAAAACGCSFIAFLNAFYRPDEGEVAVATLSDLRRLLNRVRA